MHGYIFVSVSEGAAGLTYSGLRYCLNFSMVKNYYFVTYQIKGELNMHPQPTS